MRRHGADYKRRGGKALDRLAVTANAFIRLRESREAKVRTGDEE
jgi:hypothetical protein